MELIIVKAIALSVVLVISLIAGCVPMLFVSLSQRQDLVRPRTQRRYKRTLSFISCYGGGVFFGASLLDLLPDVQESFKQLKLDQNNFPIAEFAVSVGFFIVFIIEQIILAWKEVNLTPTSEHEPLISESTSETDNKRFYSAVGTPPINASHDHDHSHDYLSSIHEDPSSHSTLRIIILFLALSVHSVFEGFAIGFQSVFGHLIQLLIAILIHKGIIALSLGINLAQSTLKLKVKVILIVIFAFASPIGIGIGMGICEVDSTSSVIAAVLQGCACGTFLYVTFFEVLPHELNHKKDRLMKLIFIILGFATICGAIVLNRYENLT